jgi:hypothetical protein
MSTRCLLPVTAGAEQQARAHNVVGRRTELGRGSERFADRCLRLQKRVAEVQRAAFLEGRRPADEDMRPGTYGAGVGGDFAEAAAVPDSFSHDYGLKVIVLCVAIDPFPYRQISYTAEPGSPFLSQSIGPHAPS